MSQFQIKSYNSRSPISDYIPSFKCPRRIQFTFTPLNAELKKETNSNIPLLMLCMWFYAGYLGSHISVFSYCVIVEMQTVREPSLWLSLFALSKKRQPLGVYGLVEPNIFLQVFS